MISDRRIESCSVGLFRFLCQVWAMCELSTLESSKIGMRLSKHLKAESRIIAVFTAVSKLKLAHPPCQVAIFVGSFVSTFLQGCGETEESLSVSDATTTEGNTTMTVTMTTTVTTVASR